MKRFGKPAYPEKRVLFKLSDIVRTIRFDFFEERRYNFPNYVIFYFVIPDVFNKTFVIVLSSLNN